MNILITGCAGFVGFHLSEFLSKKYKSENFARDYVQSIPEQHSIQYPGTKKHYVQSTIEKICIEKEIEVPENLDLIREIFLNHPINEDYDLKLKPVDLESLREWLISRDFSENRIERNFKKLD